MSLEGKVPGDRHFGGMRAAAVWLICFTVVTSLAVLRTSTNAEFAFSSLAILPVAVIAWNSQRTSGLAFACIAGLIFAIGEVTLLSAYSAAWIPWANLVTRLVTYLAVAALVSKVKSQLVKERDGAMRDALTGLMNRRAFLEAGAEEVRRSKRYTHAIAVAYLDLDDFKQINDTRGHQVGDDVLKTVADAMTGPLRSSDLVARLGGDEFAVLFPETSQEAAHNAGKKLFDAVNASLHGLSPVTASLGVAWFPAADRSFPEMLDIADKLMYEVKAAGKRNISIKNVPPARQEVAVASLSRP